MNATAPANDVFADMDDDMVFDAQVKTTVITEAMAEQKFVAPSKTHAVFTERCSKCGGTGKYFGASSYGNNCFACDGVGFKSFKTSPESREKARRAAAERKERAEAEARAEKLAQVAAWNDAHPAEAKWLVDAAARGSNFASSLLGSLGEWGSLTTGQTAAIGRCIAQDAERAAAKTASPAPKVESLPALHSVMQRHATFHAGDLTLSRRNGDQLVWIKHANAEKVIGKIDHGILTMWTRLGVDNAAVREVLGEFESAPLQTAMKYGRLSGVCCSCGRDLTDPASIEAGIGPICAQKFA